MRERNSGPASAMGRPVRVVSIGFRSGSKSLDQIAALVDREGRRGADLIALPETCRGQKDGTIERLAGPTVTRLSALARKHRAYVIAPIDRLAGKRRLNTAVLIGRDGKVAGCYDKVYPYWDEFNHALPVSPGAKVPVFETDFGRLGLAICFDANFPEVWRGLADGGAELVVWASAYSAGTALQAHALNHHYYIVTATQTADCQAYDITGERIADTRRGDLNVTRLTLDLDRGIYHYNFNLEKRDKLLSERGGDVMQEMKLDREQWFVLRPRRPGVSARTLAERYGMEELRDYVARSRQWINVVRRRPSGAKVVRQEPRARANV